MSDYWATPIYDAVQDEALSHWLRERPPFDHPADRAELCDGCQEPLCKCPEECA